ncbi:helix-turn-helix domain-containing protein [Gordonia sp. UBA6683]|uniref:helix-turn-helix domain-containing protein n=1 Tax=Gordonia sp. UBA6683 TaxID=1946577 RepID=UPI0025C40FB6|nr:helix-turn-helix domain-containing protein [Gordonia sp. UBA6683]
MATKKQYKSPTEAAIERDMSPRTMRRFIAEGKIKAVRYSERCIRIHVDELARFDAEAARNGSISA